MFEKALTCHASFPQPLTNTTLQCPAHTITIKYPTLHKLDLSYSIEVFQWCWNHGIIRSLIVFVIRPCRELIVNNLYLPVFI